MRILFVAAEAAPLTSAGPVGEAVGGLARALAARGHEVRVVLPASGAVERGRWQPQPAGRVAVPHLDGEQLARVSDVQHAGVRYHLIAGAPVSRRVLDLSSAAAAPQHLFTALAALGLCRALGWAPDMVHGFDAAGAAAVYWLDQNGLHDPLFQAAGTVFTPYHLSTAGGSGRTLLDYGLAPSDAPALPDVARATLVSLGLAHAEVLVTLSPTYAGDVLTPAHGHGLEAFLQSRGERLAAINPGLDAGVWDPARDDQLAARFSAERLDRRAANKRAMQKALGLPVRAAAPLLGLPGPDGLELAWPALRALLRAAPEAQVAAVKPSDGDWRGLEREFGDRVRWFKLGDLAFARRLHAGADVMVLPCATAPEGHAALAALRYGAVPVVHAVGGLADVVVDQAVMRRGTGFCFTDYNADVLLAALQRALRLYQQPARWQALQRRGLRQAALSTWARPARALHDHYQQAITYRKEAVTRRSPWLAEMPAAVAADPLTPMGGTGQAALR